MKIGDRVIALCNGSGSCSKWTYDREMEKGETGTIIDMSDTNMILIKADLDGKMLSRVTEYVDVIEEEIVNNYEIY